jgi:hypothetical protein
LEQCETGGNELLGLEIVDAPVVRGDGQWQQRKRVEHVKPAG